MAHAVRPYPTLNDLPRWVGTGAIAGAVSVLIVQYVAPAPLHGLALWGAIWGALLAATLARLGGARLVLAAAAFGAVLPTIVAFALLAPQRGQPTVTGVVPLAVIQAVLVNAAWGTGTGLGLAFFGRLREKLPG